MAAARATARKSAPRRKRHLEVVVELNPAFVQCRSLGHEWRHRVAIDPEEPQPFGARGMKGTRSVCEMCGTVRTKWISRIGEVMTRYRHPDGYRQKGEDRLTMAEWRQVYVRMLYEAEGETG